MEYRAVTKEDSKNELAHWKYIKKYKKDGKWKYVYYQQNLDDDLKRANERVARARDKAMKYNSGYYFDKDNPGNMEAEKQQANQSYKRLVADARRLAEKVEENKKNEAEYNKTFQKKIEDAKKWIDNLFNNIAEKL